MTRSSTTPETSPAITPAVLNTIDAARYIGVSPSTIRRLRASGSLPVARIRGRSLYRICDLDAMLAAAVGVSK